MWGPPGPPPFGPRGRRAARGDVRAAVLLLLAEEPRNGYALMQEIEERSEGVWRPSPGSIYPALAQLEDEGLVEATKEGSGRVFARFKIRFSREIPSWSSGTVRRSCRYAAERA